MYSCLYAFIIPWDLITLSIIYFTSITCMHTLLKHIRIYAYGRPGSRRHVVKRGVGNRRTRGPRVGDLYLTTCHHIDLNLEGRSGIEYFIHCASQTPYYIDKVVA